MKLGHHKSKTGSLPTTVIWCTFFFSYLMQLFTNRGLIRQYCTRLYVTQFLWNKIEVPCLNKTFNVKLLPFIRVRYCSLCEMFKTINILTDFVRCAIYNFHSYLPFGLKSFRRSKTRYCQLLCSKLLQCVRPNLKDIPKVKA